MHFTPTVVLLLTVVAVSDAQELRYIDLTAIQQRTELRTPPAPPPTCDGRNCTAIGGSSGGTIADGAPDIRDPHALGVYLLSISPTDLRPDDPFEAEFKVLNTGRAPIELPISPHLSDLQPEDAAEAFSYFSLALVVRLEDESTGTYIPSVGYAELYGSPEHKDTMLVLKPGEWIRVKAKIKVAVVSRGSISARARGEFWLRKNTFRPHPGGSSTETVNLYPNSTATPPIPVQLIQSAAPEQPNR